MTDTAANLTAAQLDTNDITVIPLTFFVDGVAHDCRSVEQLDAHEFYSTLRGKDVHTAQANPQRFVDAIEPIVQAGRDVLYIGLSSGVSGSCASAGIAAKQLEEDYPERKVVVLDSLGASFGEGLLVLRACECRDAGKSLAQTVKEIESMRERMCQIFTVDDLYYLRKNGRLSGTVAIVASLLDIKPILKGNENGMIVMSGKTRGRKRAIAAIAERYDKLVRNAQEQRIAIAHADCPEDAEALIALLKRNHPPKEILTVCYEPVTGVHVGPGALALFFEGEAGSRKL